MRDKLIAAWLAKIARSQAQEVRRFRTIIEAHCDSQPDRTTSSRLRRANSTQIRNTYASYLVAKLTGELS